MKKKPTIAELERLLNSEPQGSIEILPNGEIRAVPKSRRKKVKPITMNQDLGGEYGSDELLSILKTGVGIVETTGVAPFWVKCAKQAIAKAEAL